MEQSREKLKVIDIEFKRNNTNKQTLFFDVIEHKFEDQFLVIKHYKEYADKDVKHYGFLAEGINLLKIELEDDNREAIYIPMSNIALIEYFKSMEKFNRAYPPGNGYGY